MSGNNRFLFPIKDGYAMLKAEQILCIEGQSNYSTLQTLGGEEYLLSICLKEVENLLPDHTFYRIHKSHIINMNHINQINRKDALVHLIDGKELPIALRRLKKFLENICN